MLNRETDVIRENDRDFINVSSQNRLIKKMIGTSAENVYGFGVLFGQLFDKHKVEEMNGTYWLRVPSSDNKTYGEDVNLVTIK